MPVEVWQEMVEQHFPGCGWIRLPRDTVDALLAFRSQRALPSWEAAVRALLAEAERPVPLPGHGPDRALLPHATGRTAR